MSSENKASPQYPEQFIEQLYSSGLEAQLAFGKSERVQGKVVDRKFQFRKHIIKGIQRNKDEDEFDSVAELLSLFKLLCFIQAWADSEEFWINSDDDEYRKKRQIMKFKRDIDKSIRRSIHVGLFKAVCESLLQFKQAAEKNNAENDAEEAKFIKALLESLKQSTIESSAKKQLLIKIIKQFLEFKGFEQTENSKNNFSEAAKLITVFTLWPDKLLHGFGLAIGLIAALACGISTGGAIFIVLISFSVPLGFVIPLSVLFFLAGTRANFQLFSQNIPRFLHDLCKNGGVTEFLDGEGKRLQFSGSKKCLLFPVALFSVSVGIAAAAITLLEGTKMIALVCPLLIAACPYLPGILLGILASALLIGLSIVMFRAFIEILQSQLSWQRLEATIKEKWHSLSGVKVLAYAFKGFVMAGALFGLFFLSVTGAPTLAASLGWIVAYGISLAAFIGDVPFTLITALALCTSLLTRNNPNADLTTDKACYLEKIVNFFSLIINALGNAALVFSGSLASRIASIACFMNSYANNCIREDDGELVQARANATQHSLVRLSNSTFFTQPFPEIQIKEANKGLIFSPPAKIS